MKAAKIVAAKERKANKEEKVKKEKGVKSDVKDEFDEMAEGKKMKQSKLDFKPKKEAAPLKKGNPWSDSDGSEDLSGMIMIFLKCVLFYPNFFSGSDVDDVAPAAPRERASGPRRTTKAATYKLVR